jgi:plastocyanin
MSTPKKLSLILTAALGVSLVGVGVTSQREAGAQANSAISIKDFMYNPAEITAKAGQPIEISNNDGFVHSVTAKDGAFNIDVPPNGKATLMVPKAGSFPYSCTYHPGQHNPASITVS